MLNQTEKTKNRSQSKFLGQRRNFFLTKRKSKIGFSFLKINHGTLNVEATEMGTYKACFSSEKTGRTAFAYGATFGIAYQNLVRLFYIKYTI